MWDYTALLLRVLLFLFFSSHAVRHPESHARVLSIQPSIARSIIIIGRA